MLNKKCITLLVFVLIGFTSHSQVLLSILFGDKLNSDGLEFGLEGGFNWSDISGLDEANEKSWTVIDMKNDWKVVYPFELKN